jgi:adenylosuccinate lyase
MIPSYSRPEMAALFAPETRLGIWLDVELAAAVAANRERLIDPASRRSRLRPLRCAASAAGTVSEGSAG